MKRESPAAGGRRRGPASVQAPHANGAAATVPQAELDELLATVRRLQEGDFSARLSTRRSGPLAAVAAELNELAARNERMSK